MISMNRLGEIRKCRFRSKGRKRLVNGKKEIAHRIRMLMVGS
jgi:hypothetical protein